MMNGAGGSVIIITYSASPYQVELFNELARAGCPIFAVYLRESEQSRRWSPQKKEHEFICIDGDKSKLPPVIRAVNEAQLSIFSFYTDPVAQHLLHVRASSGRPWIFWGERPGFHVSLFVGSLIRRWKLRVLHESSAPIWGVGRWAVQEYEREFGSGHRYANVPYFSNLRRFERKVVSPNGKTVFLFSGAINKRKGVDLLATTFADLARSRSDVELIVLGEGESLGEMKESLGACADRVRFLGFKDWNELPSVYQQADFLCAPSRYDGWALVVPEALASGLPVISTDRTGAALEFIKNDTNGWLISAGNCEALLAAMKSAAGLSHEERQRYAEHAKATVSNHQLEDGVKRIMAEIDNALTNWN